MHRYGRDATGEVNLELVDADGTVMVQRPINVQELLQQEDHTLSLGNGVSLHLEAYHDTDSEGDVEESRSGSSESATEAAAATTSASVTRSATSRPPARHGAASRSWNHVLHALRRERDGSVSDSATPHKTPHREPDEEASGERLDDAKSDALFSPVAHVSMADATYNHRQLRCISVLGEVSTHRFRPSAVALAAMTAYLGEQDGGQRVLLYGGITNAGAIGQELYEFALLTGVWRRVEGRRCVPVGHFGHAMTVVTTTEKGKSLVIVGGIGRGGVPMTEDVTQDDPLRRSRAALLLFSSHESSSVSAAVRPSTRHGLVAHAVEDAAPTSAAAQAGFVPLLFDMTLSPSAQRGEWRAVQTAPPCLVAFHTAVAFETRVFVFGGLGPDLAVKDELLVIDVETYNVRRGVGTTNGRSSAAADKAAPGESDKDAPGPRYLHSAVTYGYYMIIYGGFDAQNEPCEDVWAFDTRRETWRRLNCHGTPGARAAHTACVVGSHMLIFGGFTASVEEVLHHLREGDATAVISHDVAALRLVPMSGQADAGGMFMWQSALRVTPALPSLVCASAATCGDDASLVLLGGLQPRAGGGKRASSRRPPRAASLSPAQKGQTPPHNATVDAEARQTTRPPRHLLLAQLAVYDEALLLTHPARPRRVAGQEARRGSAATDDSRTSDGPRTNALGLPVDPDAMPADFAAFVRRQQDFLKKKEAAVQETQRRVMLEEREGMEPTLYLTEDEIARLLASSEACCTAFTEEYKMDSLPNNVPDRQERIRLIEECVSLSRQIRDVVRSMKGSAPGVTAVKSKSHRHRAGRKFEDYSAAKPFRRVVVEDLLQRVNAQMHRMNHLNRALRTVEWDEKEEFVQAIGRMQTAVDNFAALGQRIMAGYVKHRVESLVKGAARHAEVMRQLTAVVEKIRHDQIFHRDDVRDPQRERVRRNWARVAPASSDEKERSRRTSTAPRANLSRGKSGTTRSVSATSGIGFFRDEAAASIRLTLRQRDELMAMAAKVQSRARALHAYCTAGVQQPRNTPAGAAPATAPAPVVVGSATTHPPVASATARVGSSRSSSGSSIASHHSAPSEKAETKDKPAEAATPSAAAAAPNATPAEAGTATTRDAVVRHSNALREQTATTATLVAETAHAFQQALAGELQNAVIPESAHAITTATTTTTPSLLVPVIPAEPTTSTVVAPPPPATTTAAQTRDTPHVVPDASKSPQSNALELRLSVVRPMLEARHKLQQALAKTPRIRLNTWDGDDLAGAPQDVKVSQLCQRLYDAVSALVQRVMSGFLTIAGTRSEPPVAQKATQGGRRGAAPRAVSRRERRRGKQRTVSAEPIRHSPPSVQVALPPAAVQGTQPVAEPIASSSSSSSSLQSARQLAELQSATEKRTSDAQPSSAAAVLVQQPEAAATTRPVVPQLHPLQEHGGMYLNDLVTLTHPAQENTTLVPTQPLISREAVMHASAQPTRTAEATKAAGPHTKASDTHGPVIEPATADVRRVPNRPAGHRTTTTQPRPAVSSLYDSPVMSQDALLGRPLYAHNWALLPSPAAADHTAGYAHDGVASGGNWPQQHYHHSGGGAGKTGPHITLAAEPEVPINSDSTQPLQQQPQPQQPRFKLPATRYGEQPITSFGPGNFIVNAEFYQPSHAARQTRAEQLPVSGDSAGDEEAEEEEMDVVEDDYFYFGRGNPRVASAHRSTITAPARLTISPAVGTALASQRVSAELVGGGSSAARSRRVVSNASTAPHFVPLSSRSHSRDGVTTRGSVSAPAAKPVTIERAAARMAADEPQVPARERKMFRGKLTPGELKILRAREQLRRR